MASPVDQKDLFGDRPRKGLKGELARRFGAAPFTVFNAREGPWQTRKKGWLDLGIRSELRRGAGTNPPGRSDTAQNTGFYRLKTKLEKETGKEWPTDDAAAEMIRRGWIEDTSLDAGTGNQVSKGAQNHYKKPSDQDKYTEMRGKLYEQRTQRGTPTQGGLTYGIGVQGYRKSDDPEPDTYHTSHFDPVLCELIYSWLCPEGGLILDPFAGCSVSGMMAALLGRRFWGCDLSPGQVETNIETRDKLLKNGTVAPDSSVTWVCGDSAEMLATSPKCDLLWSCHPAGVRVALEGGGLVNIEDIRVGDSVRTHLGRPKKVTDVLTRSYTGKLYLFHRDFRNRPLEATAEHPLFVRRNGEYVWLRAEEVRCGVERDQNESVHCAYKRLGGGIICRLSDCLVEPLPKQPKEPKDGSVVWNYEPPPVNSYFTSGVAGTSPRGQTTATANPGLARLVGYYLSEGWTQKACTGFAFHEKERDYHKDVISLFRENFGQNLGASVRAANGRGVTILCNGTTASQFFASNCGRGADKKRVPSWVFESSDEIVRQVIIGCWRGDGWSEKDGRMGYASVSEQMVEDIRRLLLRLGIVASLRRRHRLTEYCTKGKSLPQWHLSVRGVFAEKLAAILGVEIKVKSRRPGRGPWIENDYVHYPIRKIEIKEITKVPVFNMEVEDDHSYIAEGVCSHNCPPYADLEVYSENEKDLSTMDWDDFRAAYADILDKACGRLRNNRFAAIVIGDVRDKDGAFRDLPAYTKRCMVRAGLSYYNEAILVTAVGSLPIRTERQFFMSRKLGATHQYVQIFVKGDPVLATDAATGMTADERRELLAKRAEDRKNAVAWE